MNEELREHILQLLREELTIDVKTDSVYTGGLDGGDLYRNSHTLTISLSGEVISSVYLD